MYCTAGTKWLIVSTRKARWLTFKCGCDSQLDKINFFLDEDFEIPDSPIDCPNPNACNFTDMFYRTQSQSADDLIRLQKINVLFYVTHYCPQECVYCNWYRRKASKIDFLPIGLYEKLLDKLALKYPRHDFEFRFTGGEPLFCKDIGNMIEMAHRKFDRMTTLLFTSIPSAKALSDLVRGGQLSRSQVYVSCHPSARLFNMIKFWEGIRLLASNGIPVVINMIDHEVNDPFRTFCNEMATKLNVRLDYCKCSYPRDLDLRKNNPIWNAMRLARRQRFTKI